MLSCSTDSVGDNVLFIFAPLYIGVDRVVVKTARYYPLLAFHSASLSSPSSAFADGASLR